MVAELSLSHLWKFDTVTILHAGLITQIVVINLGNYCLKIKKKTKKFLLPNLIT